MTDEDIIVHINKNASVSDLLRVVREKMAPSLPVPERKLRLIEVFSIFVFRILKLFSVHEFSDSDDSLGGGEHDRDYNWK